MKCKIELVQEKKKGFSAVHLYLLIVYSVLMFEFVPGNPLVYG